MERALPAPGIVPEKYVERMGAAARAENARETSPAFKEWHAPMYAFPTVKEKPVETTVAEAHAATAQKATNAMQVPV